VSNQLGNDPPEVFFLRFRFGGKHSWILVGRGCVRLIGPMASAPHLSLFAGGQILLPRRPAFGSCPPSESSESIFCFFQCLCRFALFVRSCLRPRRQRDFFSSTVRLCLAGVVVVSITYFSTIAVILPFSQFGLLLLLSDAPSNFRVFGEYTLETLGYMFQLLEVPKFFSRSSQKQEGQNPTYIQFAEVQYR
jgi:hypothetical protein